MAWRSVLSCIAVAASLAALAPDAAANGRPPATSSITFRPGNEQEIAVGLTFGLLLSHDGGKTWAWFCENAFPFTGMYDPKFAYASSGALFATTFDGIKVMRDSCTFNPVSADKRFVTDVIAEPANNTYYAASEPGDSGVPPDFKLYRSIDDGQTFPTAITPSATAAVTWWQTLRAAPSDAKIMYLTGYGYVPGPPDGDGKPTKVRKHLMFRSADSGQTWNDLQIDTGKGITLMPNSAIDVAGIASDDPAHLFIRVELDDNTMSDSIYESTNSGATWTKRRSKPVSILGFVVRANHDLVLATQALGTEVSHDNGATWEAVAGAPHINCLTENKAGELWACTQNFSSVGGGPTDDAGIMKTTDLATWTKVLRYQDLTDAASCGADTVQAKECVPMWCAVCLQLGCHPSASYNCPVPAEAPVVEPKSGGGCCETGSTGSGALALGLVIGTVLLRPRRRRQANHEPGARCS